MNYYKQNDGDIVLEMKKPVQQTIVSESFFC